MRETVNTIVINWEKFDILSRDHYVEVVEKLNTPIDYGLYQFYGNHLAYGKDALLYIGRSVNSTFSKRLLETTKKGQEDEDHNRMYEIFESTATITQLRIGRISTHNEDDKNSQLEEYKKNWDQNIEIAERILIATHTPAFNKQLNHLLGSMNYGMSPATEDQPEVSSPHQIIINFGDFGSISPELSTLRNSYYYFDYDKYLSTE